jgi:glycosyltransferase involved in cell wall biosynthesis
MSLTVAYVVDEWITLSQTFIRNEIAELRRMGVEVHIVALRHGDVEPPEAEAARFLSDRQPGSALGRVAAIAGHPIAALRLRRTQLSMRPERLPFRAVIPAVAAELRAEGIQWVHAHFGWAGAGVAEGLAALCGVGWSFTAHAHDIFVANEHFRGKARRADRVVTVCEYNRGEIAAMVHLPRPVEVVVCGVEVPPPANTAGTGADVVAVGRLVPKKGFDLLVRATAMLTPRWPALRVEIVGDGPERAALAGLAQELDVADRVAFVGAESHEDVLERIARARVVCLPARIAADGDRDSMPVVLKEAMARSVPVVGTDVAAIPEMVDDSVGRLVAPENPDALAEAIASLLADPAAAARAGAAGRARVEARFTLAGEVGRLRRMFEMWSAEKR